MHYHDFHLESYTVSDFGNKITFHLLFESPSSQRSESLIVFSDVAAYNFIHTGGTIITDIEEISISSLLKKVGNDLHEWYRLYGGYLLWDTNRTHYGQSLQEEGYRAWEISSAIGFGGFIIAKTVNQEPPAQSN